MTTFEGRRTGRTYPIGEQLDRNGHAVIHAVDPDSSGLALKRYLPGTLRRRPELEARIKAMVAGQPAYRTGPGSLICAWPEDIAYISGRFAGYLMPRVDTEGARAVPDVATSPDRSWRDRVTVAENLARAVAVLHDAGVVIGDFRARNLLTWNDGRVALLGCDRMQVTDPSSGRRFPCVADRDACTPPELLLASLTSTTLRTSSSDIFPLAIQLHMLLLHGTHPFRGRWKGSGDRPTEQQLAQAGLWCYAGDPRLEPDPGAAPPTVLPDPLRQLFRAAFVDGARHPEARPPAQEWLTALERLRHSLVDGERDTTRRPSPRPAATAAAAGPAPQAASHPPPPRPAPPDPPTPRAEGPTRTRHLDSADPRPHPAGRRLAAWAAAAVVVVGGSLFGVVRATQEPAPVTEPAVAASTDTTSTPSPAPRPVDPTEALEQIRTQDAATVDTLAESWVAQLSTRPAATRPADRVATDAAVLAGHDALRSQYPGAVLLWSPDWNYDGRFWITVMSRPFATAEEANAWCDTNRFAQRDCFAKKLSRSGGVAGSARYR